MGPPSALSLALWTGLACAAAFALAIGWLPSAGIPEWGHLLAHTALFALPAAFLARRWRADHVLLAVLGAGLAVEVAQMVGAGRWLLAEATFDLAVDGLAAMAGLAVSNRREVAQRLGVWLHPVLLFPVGLAGVLTLAEGNFASALGWTALAVACLSPSGAMWVYGSQRGWWSDLDLVEREERPLLFAVACLSAVSFACAVRAGHAGPAVVGVADAVLLASVVLTAVTLLGLKISGHVTICLLLAVLVAPWSPRAPVLFCAAAALLSWARIRASVHRPTEVAAAWVLGGVLLWTHGPLG